MSRSTKKGPFVHPKLLKKIKKILELPVDKRDKYPIRTWSRDSVILPEMVGMVFEVHNGKQFISVKVVEDMVGHRLGEFSPTRKFIKHGGKLQRELERRQTAQK
ncbi:MAG: 30S ribosomal protein S19 [Patescibacteria group bacterium]|nr:30S ribosomal protein S19 [Patescibacteria group bacterium]